MIDLRNMESHTLPNGDLEIRLSNSVPFILEPGSIEFIDAWIQFMGIYYPEKLQALKKEYYDSIANRLYYRFLIVRRDIKCNIGSMHNQFDIDVNNTIIPEFVACPMRGECTLWKIVCEAKRATGLVKSELAILQELVDGLDASQIAQKLHLSIHTVNTHRNNMLKKLNLHSTAQLVDYYYKNKLNESYGNKR